MQFHGEFQHRIDGQSRVAIPSRYREAFKGGIYLTRGFDPCVWAFSPEEWSTYSARYSSMSPNSRMARTLRRRVFGSTYDLELDRQGRVVMPQVLRQYAGLQEDVVLVGVGNWIEIWDLGRWEAQLAEIEAADLDFADEAPGTDA